MRFILGDLGADSGGEGKSKRAGKYKKKLKKYIYIAPILFSAKRLNLWNEEKKRTARRAPGDNVLPHQFQTVAVVVASDWCQKTFVFLCPVRRQNGGDRLKLVW